MNEDALDDFISAPAVVLERLIEKTYVLPPKPVAMKRQEREERMQERMAACTRETAMRSSRLAGTADRPKISYKEIDSDEDDYEESDEESESEDEEPETSDYDDDDEMVQSDEEDDKNRHCAEQKLQQEAAAKEASDAYVQAAANKKALLDEARQLKLPPNP